MNNRTDRFSGFFNRYGTVIIIAIALATVAFFVSLTGLGFDSDIEKLILPPEDGTDESTSGRPVVPPSEYPLGFAILIDSPDLFNPLLLDEIDTAMEKLEAFVEIGPSLSPFSFITIEKRGTRLVTVPMNPHQRGTPWTMQESELFKQRLEQDDIAKGYLYSSQGDAFLIYYSIKPLGIRQAALLAEFEQILAPIKAYATVSTMSSALIQEQVTQYLGHDLFILLGVCLAMILVVYYLSFRAKRAVLIPFSVSAIGIVWTLGAMQLLGYQMTIINVITPCVILTLGSSYSIHMLNEYFGTWRKDDPNSIGKAVSRISSTIAVASITTIFGFLSLLVSDSRAFKEFGLSVAIGVGFCAILSITYLPAVLVRTVPPKQKHTDAYHEGILFWVIEKTGRFSIKHWKSMLAVFAITVAVGFVAHDFIKLDTNYMSYFPKDNPVVQSSLRIAEKMGSTSQYHITLSAPAGQKEYFLQPEVLANVHEFETSLMESCPDIVHSLSFSMYVKYLNRIYSGSDTIPDTAGLMRLLSRMVTLIGNQLETSALATLISEDDNQMTLSMRNYDSVEQDLQTVSSSKRIKAAVAANMPILNDGIRVVEWGTVVDSLRTNDVIMGDQRRSTVVSFVLILVVACITFRSVKDGLLALVPVLVGIMASYILMLVLGIPFDLVTVGFSSVTVGAGVDDALHFLLRYRSLRKHEQLKLDEALYKTILLTGRPIILSTFAVISGLLVLLFASYVPIRFFGLLVSMALMNSLLATLFILPAVMIFLDIVYKRLHRKTASGS